jgi:hypothetical protein
VNKPKKLNKPDKQDMPDKPYDTGWKSLLDLCAQDLLDWIVGKVVFNLYLPPG